MAEKKKSAEIETAPENEETQEVLDVLNEGCECGAECTACTGIAPVLRKLNQVRADIAKLDWTPDRLMKIGPDKNKWYPYLSIDKIKGQMGSAFARQRLEVFFQFTDLEFRPAIGNMSQHVTLTMCVTAADIDTGSTVEYVVFGEAGDSGDKAIAKAQTYAMKTWLTSAFMLSEGFDPDIVDATNELPDTPKMFVRTPIEEVEMRSKVLDAGLKPAAPAAPAKPATKPAAPAPKPAAPAPKQTVPVQSDATDKKPTPIQLNTMKKIMDAWDAALKDGSVSVEAYNKASFARAAVGTSGQAVDFITEYEKVA